jgi:hypothetical protein
MSKRTLLTLCQSATAFLALSVVIPACQNGESGSGSLADSSAAREDRQLVGEAQGHSLEMNRGRSVVRFPITALPPPEHTFDVYVEAPATADVGVRMRTWYGQRLSVLRSTRDRTSCSIRERQVVCQLAFPRLEAQRPGEWTVVVIKRSRPPARVRVEVTFQRQ